MAASTASVPPAGRQAPPPVPPARQLPFSLRLLPVLAAALSMLAGAVLSVLPALVVGLVRLFYNSAGGVLILLGSLIDLLPRPGGIGPGGIGPAGVGPGGGGMPAFQALDTDTTTVLMQSVLGTVLCAAAFVIVLMAARRRDLSLPFAAAICALAAARLGGRNVAMALAPGMIVMFADALWHRIRSL